MYGSGVPTTQPIRRETGPHLFWFSFFFPYFWAPRTFLCWVPPDMRVRFMQISLSCEWSTFMLWYCNAQLLQISLVSIYLSHQNPSYERNDREGNRAHVHLYFMILRLELIAVKNWFWTWTAASKSTRQHILKLWKLFYPDGDSSFYPDDDSLLAYTFSLILLS